MIGNFPKALSHTLVEEGGFSDNKADPGGATMKGVTLAVYQEYRRNTHLTPSDLQKITDAELFDIYKKRYWDACSCDQMPSGVDVAVFDCAVNSGVARASKLLQECVGSMPDGVIGKMTINAANQADPQALISDFCGKRQAFLEALKTFPIFGKGWTARVARVKDFALTMV